MGNKQGQRSQVNTAALISLAQISTMAIWNGEESLLTNGGEKMPGLAFHANLARFIYGLAQYVGESQKWTVAIQTSPRNDHEREQ